MKNSVLILYLFISTSFIHPRDEMPAIIAPDSASENLFIILTDGFRWQEMFNGADSLLIHDEKFTPDTATIKSMYWAATKEERRVRLLPFMWNVVAAKGQLFGNRDLNNKVNVSNIYSISYPGYSEIFTGTNDIKISGNGKIYNKNLNVLEYLDQRCGYEGKIAVFSSWNVFPYILNRKRSRIMMNCGYEQINNEDKSEVINMINAVQEKGIEKGSGTRYDLLTYSTAKEYIRNHQPRIVVISFGETDDFAHQKRYDLYLQQANQVDRMIGELWNMVQTTPAYKNKTNFLITTDHGRGNGSKHWSGHGFFIAGSSQTWFAMMGPAIQPTGERNKKEQLYSKQLAGTIVKLAGAEFTK